MKLLQSDKAKTQLIGVNKTLSDVWNSLMIFWTPKGFDISTSTGLPSTAHTDSLVVLN